MTVALRSSKIRGLFFGGVPERPKGADCKSAGSTFGGSNPPPSTKYNKGMVSGNREVGFGLSDMLLYFKKGFNRKWFAEIAVSDFSSQGWPEGRSVLCQ